MKRVYFIIVLCVITLGWGISHAGVVGTPHDLSWLNQTDPGNFSYFFTNQTCIFCHTPHGARTDVSITTFWNGTGYINNSPGSGSFVLWNRALPGHGPGDPDVKGFDLYTSSTFDSASGQLNVYTLMCLGCHDGVGALNVLNNYPSDPQLANPDGPVETFPSGQATQIGAAFDGSSGIGWGPNIGQLTPADIGTDSDMHLANDHPVSIDYTIAGGVGGVDDDAFVDPNIAQGYVGSTAVRLFPDPESGVTKMIECSTCHNVHDNSNDNFLVMSNDGSALCTSCHIK